MSKILEQIFDKGYAIKDVKLAKGKFKAKVKNLSAEEQLGIEAKLSSYNDKSSAFVLHQYSIHILEQTVLSLNGDDYKPGSAALAKVLGKLPTPIVDALIQAQNKFEKDIAKLINPDNVDKAFFEKESTPEGSGQ